MTLPSFTSPTTAWGININASCLQRVYISLIAFGDDLLHGSLKIKT